MFVTKFRAGPTVERPGPGSDFWFLPMTRTASGVNVTPQTSMTLPTVFACVRVLSESFAVMPFWLYRRRGGSKARTAVTDHWLYRLFALRPNRWQNPYEFRLMLQGHLALRGNAFCRIVEGPAGSISELIPLHPDRMSAEMIDEHDYRYIYRTEKGEKIALTRGEVWHLRGLSDDGVVGLNPIEAHREAIGEGLAMQSYASRFFGNDARPPGWIEYPGTFKDAEQKSKWRDSWQRMQGGSNRGKVAVLDRGMKYHEIGVKNTDAQFLEQRSAKVGDIARIFRVPPHMIGDLSGATRSNMEAQSIEFWTGTMMPYSEGWEASIEYSLLGKGLGVDRLTDELDVEFDMDRMMRGDAASRSAYFSSRTQWGSMTPNEVREREGDEPLPWLDFTMRPVNMVRVDESGEHMIDPLGRPAAGDQTPPADSGSGNNSTPADQSAARSAERVAEVADMAKAKIRSLVTGAATRMARRVHGGQATSAEVLADALAIDQTAAQSWLMVDRSGKNEAQLAAELADLAMSGVQ